MKIKLTGLRADVPIGFMAAVGCLRVCERSDVFRGSKLGWERAGGSFTAILCPANERSADELVAVLLADVKTAAERTELKWRTKLKGLTVEEYRDAARNAVEQGRQSADWFAAFGCEVVTDRDGHVEPTPLDMTGGPQAFLAGAVELAEKLSAAPKGRKAKSPERAFREALFGPWEYTDDQHSLGWDPATIKLGAFTYQAPTRMANSGVMAAVWLAFESLPMFPCFSGGTRGFDRKGRGFCWPVWDMAPLSVEAIGSLLALAPNSMIEHGAAGVYRSVRFYLNKYYAAFQVPELVPVRRAAAV